MANPLRNAMVYLGLAEEQDESMAPAAAKRSSAPAARAEESLTQEFAAPVTPIKPAAAPASAPKPATRVAGAMNEILTVHPKAYDKDAQLIAENFRDGVPVIMNLSQMTDADARRIIDFASGLTQGLNGRIERVTSRVFLLTPESIRVHSEEQNSRNDEPTFFA